MTPATPYVVRWIQVLDDGEINRFRSFSTARERDQFRGVMCCDPSARNVTIEYVDGIDFETPAHRAAFSVRSFTLKSALAALSAFAAVSVAGCASTATPAPTAVPAIVATYQQTTPPSGFVGLCVREPASDVCQGGTDAPRVVTLTPETWKTLADVNDYANRLPEFPDDNGDYWREADTTGGDCEDIALEKRRLLIERGFPSEALLMTAVRQWNGDGHAVLMVITDRGEFILDNIERAVMRANAAPYVYVSRQSARRPFVWLNMDASKRRASAMAWPPIGRAPWMEARR